MPSAVEEAAHRRVKAPQRSGECLIEPSVADWDLLWQGNLGHATSYPQPLAAWRTEARREMCNAALHFTRAYRDVNPEVACPDRLILSGHQPNLFHPGVWFKHFVLSHLGQRYSAGAVQLIIDNDLYRQPAIRLPAGSIQNPRIEHLSLDRVAQAIPYELAAPSDLSLFQSFGDRVAQTIQHFLPEPIIQHFWPRALREQRRVVNVGQALAAARHAIEGENGLQTLELPLSSICKTESFRQFVAHICARANSFTEIHNRCLAEFRLRHKLRSPSHPVPDLNVAPSEIELPFWVWSSASPIRRRLYVHRAGGEMILSDHHGLDCRVGSEREVVDRLGQLELDGISIRPRALMTTMYARIVLSDMFVHGIGGATYDIVTDEIVRRFFLIEPPRFLIVTATLHLPIPCPDVSERELLRIDGELRDLKYHPENHLDPSEQAMRELANTKRLWIDRAGSERNLKERHDAIREINRRLFLSLENRVTEWQLRRLRMMEDVQRSKIFASREYSFVLFPDALFKQLHALTPAAN